MYKGLWHLNEGLYFCVTDGKAPETIQMLSKTMDILVASIAKKEGGRSLALNASVVMSSSQASRTDRNKIETGH
jgi:hypothetical protein